MNRLNKNAQEERKKSKNCNQNHKQPPITKEEGNNMKRIFVLLAVVLLGTTFSLAQKNESLEKGMFFSSRDDAEDAFYSGNFRYYQPDPKNIKTRLPYLAKGLPCAYVALEVVRENSGKSPSWVLLSEGIPGVFDVNGKLVIDGRCWNRVKEAFALSRKAKDGKDGSPGPQGPEGPRGRDGHDSLLVVEGCNDWKVGVGIGAVGNIGHISSVLPAISAHIGKNDWSLAFTFGYWQNSDQDRDWKSASLEVAYAPLRFGDFKFGLAFGAHTLNENLLYSGFHVQQEVGPFVGLRPSFEFSEHFSLEGFADFNFMDNLSIENAGKNQVVRSGSFALILMYDF